MEETMRISLAALALLVAGCGSLTEEEFAESFWDTTCDLMFECTSAEEIEAAGAFWMFGEDAAACKALTDEGEGTEDTGDTCEFDAEAASTCLDEYQALTCDDLTAGTTPDTCSTVCG